MIKNKFQKPIKILKTDNGSEYINTSLRKFYQLVELFIKIHV